MKQKKLFDRINDLIFDNPYLTAQKDSANTFLRISDQATKKGLNQKKWHFIVIIRGNLP